MTIEPPGCAPRRSLPGPTLRCAATIVVAGAGAPAALAAWLAATQGQRRAAFIEGLAAAIELPDEVPVTRLAAGCVCCLGQVALRVGVVRTMRSARPDVLLLVLSGGAHVPRVRALLADGSLGVRFDVEAADDEHAAGNASEGAG